MARKLKYHAPNTDLRALERELSGGREDIGDERPDDDEFAAYADRYDSGDDDEVREEDWSPPERKLADTATPADRTLPAPAIRIQRNNAMTPEAAAVPRPPSRPGDFAR